MQTALSLINQAYEEGWEELDLSGMELTELPPEIGKLVQLKRLILGKYNNGNQLTELPSELWQLQQLEELYLAENEICEIPDLIAQLINLTTLNLEQNQITYIPDSIAQLVNLTTLNLGYNQISQIPDSIAQLVNLATLYIYWNQVTEIPDSIAHLINLTALNIGKNYITKIPDSIAQLVNLTTLYLWGNQITEIPDSTLRLVHLTTLSLSQNRITEIPDSISNLVNLTTLSLWGNQITEIPDSISNLVNLITFYLDFNKIQVIPEWFGNLSALKLLDLARNQIGELPQTLTGLKNLNLLNLSNNPLSIPAETLRQGWGEKQSDPGNPKAVLDYYFTTRDPNQTQDIYEAKLLIVGEGGCGKTSLANKLINPDYDLKPETEDISTEGIDILDWEFTGTNGKDYKIHIWDFGGQEIYHQTHQFFLTDRACYLLVADDRKENTDHYYWLQSIQLLGKDSPIHLIQNERGDRTCTLNTNQLRGEFETLRATHRTNLKDNRGLNTLKLALQHEIEKLLPHGIPFPNKWLNVRHTLENDSRNYINIC